MMRERRKGKVRTKSGKSCRLIHSGMDYTHIFFSSFFLLQLTNRLTGVIMFEAHCCP